MPYMDLLIKWNTTGFFLLILRCGRLYIYIHTYIHISVCMFVHIWGVYSSCFKKQLHTILFFGHILIAVQLIKTSCSTIQEDHGFMRLHSLTCFLPYPPQTQGLKTVSNAIWWGSMSRFTDNLVQSLCYDIFIWWQTFSYGCIAKTSPRQKVPCSWVWPQMVTFPLMDSAVVQEAHRLYPLPSPGERRA